MVLTKKEVIDIPVRASPVLIEQENSDSGRKRNKTKKKNKIPIDSPVML